MLTAGYSTRQDVVFRFERSSGNSVLFYAPSPLRRRAVQYRHVILEKEGPGEKPAANDKRYGRAGGNNLWRKVYFPGSGVTRARENEQDRFL